MGFFNTVASLLLVLSLIVCATADNVLTTTRHIYNRSGEPWTVRATVFGGDMEIFPEIGASHVGDNDFLVEDNGSLEVVYPTQYLGNEDLDAEADILGGYGSWTLIDKNGHYVVYDWSAKFFELWSVYIEHDGATDLMNLNHPADGDIDIWGPTF